jgi:flagellar biosynthesis anti-sigma factor FlgM
MPDHTSIGIGLSSSSARPAALRHAPGVLGPPARANTSNGNSPASNVNRHEADRVELSDRAQLLERLRQLPEVREALVSKVRRQIAEGTYETPQRIESAIKSLIEEIASGDVS